MLSAINTVYGGGKAMSMINKEIAEFRTYAFHENEFKFVSKEDILGKWSEIEYYDYEDIYGKEM